ncbi:MAG: argininosuccinate lyase [Calditrichaeota bacterium]|nr:MAG: argininosuccinate lyase [Calditrichota bacterium]MBL1205727.1 argininosuccinate lyase [Calditrichota bacterium]NOG45555.1 argininosuccinate lyase [Calditrichota bacterium]
MKKQSKKLWDKGTDVNEWVERFTVGEDRNLDIHLAKHDVLGSIAHITMLQSIDLLSKAELVDLKKGLVDIFKQIEQGHFQIKDGVEDVHSQVELLLTEKLGEVGKKIHSGRSRNDQVLLDMRLFIREQLQLLVEEINQLFKQLIQLSEINKNVLMPGYTHMQIAMPSSFGLWFAAYAESFVDDILQIQSAFKITNKNPLGSAAGYGSNFPLNRKMTAELLGFDDLNYNSVYAQMGRGRSERVVSQAISSVAETLAKMAMDITLFMSQNFNFISFPNSIVTGSSIMPHKKNPDLFEILRGRCNRLKALPNQIMMTTTNLTSGYHRDLQLIKEDFLPALFEIRDCVKILNFALKEIKVKENILDDPKYINLFTVEAVNELVMQGVPFRDAYKQIAEKVEKDKFEKPAAPKYSHEGSIGNLCNDEIESAMSRVLNSFEFDKSKAAIVELLK